MWWIHQGECGVDTSGCVCGGYIRVSVGWIHQGECVWWIHQGECVVDTSG